MVSESSADLKAQISVRTDMTRSSPLRPQVPILHKEPYFGNNLPPDPCQLIEGPLFQLVFVGALCGSDGVQGFLGSELLQPFYRVLGQVNGRRFFS